MIESIPRHEPEIIAAAVRRRRDTDKIPTTSLKNLIVDGVQISSRYRDADELDRMAQMVMALLPGLRALVVSVFCDTKASHSYELITRPCNPGDLASIAKATSAACLRLAGGHNDIVVHSSDGAECSIDPDWSEPEQ